MWENDDHALVRLHPPECNARTNPGESQNKQSVYSNSEKDCRDRTDKSEELCLHGGSRKCPERLDNDRNYNWLYGIEHMLGIRRRK
jgi:hypothetical protein